MSTSAAPDARSACPERQRVGPPDRLAVWTGLAMLVLLGGGFAIAGLIPPPGPGESAADIAAFYRDRVDLRRVGVIMLIVGGMLFIPFGAAIADRLRRIEGIGSATAFTEVGAACATAVLITTFASILLVALLRPDLPDTTYRLLNDLTFLAYVGLWQPGALMAAATAAGVLSDRSATPAFPRWVGWFSAWMALGSLTGSLVPFFVSGPFAWNGFIGFFVAAVVYFSWLAVMFLQLHRLVIRAAAPPPPGDEPAARTRSEVRR